jgi:hypothetical protein
VCHVAASLVTRASDGPNWLGHDCTAADDDNTGTLTTADTYKTTTMAEPTKAETEQVFKILRGQKANQVRSAPSRSPPLLH